MHIWIFTNSGLAVFTVWLTACVWAVDRSNFKRCQDSSFCRYHRDVEVQTFKALPDSMHIGENHAHGYLNRIYSDEKLMFDLYALQDKTVRLKINEYSPLRERYEIPEGDVIQPLQSQNFHVKEETKDHIVLVTSDGLHLTIRYDPFILDARIGNTQVLRVNSRQLLHILKSKQAKKKNSWWDWVLQTLDFFGEDENIESEEDWSEKFHSHTDSRPYGPTSLGMDVTFINFTRVYGLPEHAHTDLALKSTMNDEPYRLYNLDVFEYELDNNMALYGSVPVIHAHSLESTAGIFWNNPSETWIDIEYSLDDIGTHWMSESGIIDLFLMMGPTPKDVFRQYAQITGTTPTPPLFAIAYHQSRWNYMNENDIDGVVKGFDDNSIPVDVLWLDIEHTYDKRYFTFDSNKFPTPKKMLNKVAKLKRRMVTAVDPHLKKDLSHYKVYSAASRGGMLVRDKDGKEYEGWCWPGSSAWLDFINPEVRKFWAEQFLFSNYEGSTDHLFTWNDMNEPSVFNGPEITMHKDAIHYGEREHREVHNVYGLYVHRSSFEGQLLRSKGRARPFVLSRSFYSGSQKYGAVWTGDNAAEWSHLEASLSMLMTLNLVGITFSGADVGGFFKDPTPELLVRWYQAAAFQPFFRAHAHLDTKRREPWLYGKQEMALIRAAIETRYRLLPYWYLIFAQSETTGEPIMRPLWTEFPHEPDTFDTYKEHLVGDAILVHPVTWSGATVVQVHLPGCGEVWYDSNYKAYNGCIIVDFPVSLEDIPTFYRGGRILPIRERIRRSAMAAPEDPYSLLVYLNHQGESWGSLYHDDFLSYMYREGHYVYRNFTFGGGKLTSRSLNQASSNFTTQSWIERIYIVGLQREVTDLIIISEGGNRSLEGTYKDEEMLLVIRKPGVNINTDFTIVLTF